MTTPRFATMRRLVPAIALLVGLAVAPLPALDDDAANLTAIVESFAVDPVPNWAMEGSAAITNVRMSYGDVATFTVRFFKSPLRGHELAIADAVATAASATDAATRNAAWADAAYRWDVMKGDPTITIPDTVDAANPHYPVAATVLRDRISAMLTSIPPADPALAYRTIFDFMDTVHAYDPGDAWSTLEARLREILGLTGSGKPVDWNVVSGVWNSLTAGWPVPAALGAQKTAIDALVAAKIAASTDGIAAWKAAAASSQDAARLIADFLDAWGASDGRIPPRVFRMPFTVAIMKPGDVVWTLVDQGSVFLARAYSTGWYAPDGSRVGSVSGSTWYGDCRRTFAADSIPVGSKVLIVADPKGVYGGRTYGDLLTRAWQSSTTRIRNLAWTPDNRRGIYVDKEEEAVHQDRTQDVIVDAADPLGTQLPFVGEGDLTITWLTGSVALNADMDPVSPDAATGGDTAPYAAVATDPNNAGSILRVRAGTADSPVTLHLMSAHTARLRIMDPDGDHADNQGLATYRLRWRAGAAHARAVDAYAGTYRFDQRSVAWTAELMALDDDGWFFRRYDADSDGWISQPEFLRYMTDRDSGDIARTVRVLRHGGIPAIETADAGGDGLIQAGDMPAGIAALDLLGSIDLAYLVVLGRHPKPDEIDLWQANIIAGNLTVDDIPGTLLADPAYVASQPLVAWTDPGDIAGQQSVDHEVQTAAGIFFEDYDTDADGTISMAEYGVYREDILSGILQRKVALASQGIIIHGAGEAEVGEVDTTLQTSRYDDLHARLRPPVLGAVDADGNHRIDALEWNRYRTWLTDGTILASNRLYDADTSPGKDRYARFDVDDNGLITPSEAADAETTDQVETILTGTYHAAWLFAAFDANGDHVIQNLPASASEYGRFQTTAASSTLGNTVMVHDNDPTRFRWFDLNGNGLIEQAEFGAYGNTRETDRLDPYLKGLLQDVNGVTTTERWTFYQTNLPFINQTITIYHDRSTTRDRFAAYDLNMDGIIQTVEMPLFDRTKDVYEADMAQQDAGQPFLFEYYDIDRNTVISEAEHTTFNDDRSTNSGRFSAMGIGSQPTTVPNGVNSPTGTAGAGYATPSPAPTYTP